MLPFLKKKDAGIATVIIKHRNPDTVEPSENTSESKNYMEECVEELIHAIHSKDVKAATQALKDLFQEMEEQPHHEGEHIEKGEE